jgi:hypothetical protein
MLVSTNVWLQFLLFSIVKNISIQREPVFIFIKKKQERLSILNFTYTETKVTIVIKDYYCNLLNIAAFLMKVLTSLLFHSMHICPFYCSIYVCLD